MTAFGPYETEQAAAAEPMPQAVHDLPFNMTDPGRASRELQLSFLREACADAGVELGRFDLRILTWLSSYEPATVQVVMGLISRAHTAEVAKVSRERDSLARRCAERFEETERLRAHINKVLKIVGTWAADPGAYPDGAADPLQQIADLLGLSQDGRGNRG